MPILDYTFNESDSTQILILDSNICDKFVDMKIQKQILIEIEEIIFSWGWSSNHAHKDLITLIKIMDAQIQFDFGKMLDLLPCNFLCLKTLEPSWLRKIKFTLQDSYTHSQKTTQHDTQKSVLARKDLQHITHVRVHLCKSLTLDLIFRFFNHFVLYSESYQGIYACCVSCYTQGKQFRKENLIEHTHTNTQTYLHPYQHTHASHY